jgi:hypothetical protein
MIDGIHQLKDVDVSPHQPYHNHHCNVTVESDARRHLTICLFITLPLTLQATCKPTMASDQSLR